MSSYPKEQIPPHGRSIRLLTLHSEQDSERDGDIACSLSEATDLDVCQGKYEALSYQWGDPGKRMDVTCNGQPFSITENLFTALRRLRLTWKPRTLWIDAMCINQQDIIEKNHQVTLMAQIYSLCHGVVIWLGEEDDETASAFELMRQVHQRIVYPELLRDPRMLLVAWSNPTRFMTKYGLPLGMSPKWYSVRRIFDRHYWLRMWILQEVILGHDARVHCGGYDIPLKDMQDIQEAMFLLHIAAMMGGGMEGLMSIKKLQDLRTSGTPEIFDFLRFVPYSISSFDCDRVFALYGLTSDPVTGGVGIPVDYGMGPVNLLHSMAVNDLRRMALLHQRGAEANDIGEPKSLRQLSFACLSLKPNPDLPSWVPDWTKPFPCHVLPRQSGSRDIGALLFPNSKFQPMFREEDSQLQVKAVMIDIIAVCGKAVDKTDKPDTRRWGTMRPQFLEVSINSNWIRMAFSGYPSEKRASRTQELFETVNGGDDFEYDPQSFDQWIRHNWALGLLTALRLYYIHWAIHQVIALFLQSILVIFGYLDRGGIRRPYLMTTGRRVCKTEKGHLLLGPANTAVGDVVMVLQGGPLPFILRRRAEKEISSGEPLKLVGEACMPVLTSRRLDLTTEEQDSESIALMGENDADILHSVVGTEPLVPMNVWLE